MASEKQWRSGDQVISYQAGGEGIPLVLVHGFAEDHTVWERQQPTLERSFNTIALDLPGSGGSTAIPDYGMENLARCILRVLDRESIGKCILIGHSMGGYASLAFAELFPDRLKALGLFSSTAWPDSEEKKANRRKSIDFMRQHGVPKFQEQTIPNLFSKETKKEHPEMVEDLVKRYSGFSVDVLSGCYDAMMRRPDRTSVLDNIEVPVLFIIGEQDTVIPPDQMTQQTRLPLVAHVETLQHSGHMGMWEESERSTNIIVDFCKGI